MKLTNQLSPRNLFPNVLQDINQRNKKYTYELESPKQSHNNVFHTCKHNPNISDNKFRELQKTVT